MMIDSIIALCKQEEVSLALSDEGGLDIYTEKLPIKPELLSMLKEHKHELMLWLKQQNQKKLVLPAIVKIDAVGEIPLSFSQQRFWFIDRFSGPSYIYNMKGSFALNSAIDRKAIQDTFAYIVQKHDAFRVSFHEIDGKPVQRIAEHVDFHVEFESASVEQGDSIVEKHGQYLFDLTKSPLLSIKIIEVNDAQYVVSVNMPHIISDGWSLGVWVKEFNKIYSAYSQGSVTETHENKLSYADFALWQRAWVYDLNAEGLETPSALVQPMLDYWETHLQGAPAELKLPYDHEPAEATVAEGGKYQRMLSAEHAAFLRAMSTEANTNLFASMLCALKMLMFRWCGQADVVVGTVMAGRNQVELESMIGCFINFLALRTPVAEQVNADQFLSAVSETVLGALNHQDCPFDLVVNHLNPEQRNVRSPFYNISFRLHNMQIDNLEIGGVDIKSLSMGVGIAQLDLEFEAAEVADGILFSVGYDRGLFDESTAELLFVAYEAILDQWVQDRHRQLVEFQLPNALIEQAKQAHRDQQQLVVCSTFTVEPLEETFSLLSEELDFPLDVQFAPYNQPFQQLLDPSSLVSTNSGGFNLFLVRWDDWFNNKTLSDVERNCADFIDAIKLAAGRSSAPIIVQFCPLAPEAQADWMTACVQFEQAITAAVAELSHVHILTEQQLNTYYPVVNYHDAHGEQLGHMPYTPKAYTALATHAFRKIHALSRPPYKVIVLDCDNTLWKGVCGEVGALGVEITPAFNQLQSAMLRQRQQGLVLCLCSKNNEEDAVAVFATHPDMQIRLDDVVTTRINWLAKSDNIRSMAEELNLGLDSFIFIDDDPVQCMEVRSQLPQVLVMQLPKSESEIETFLLHFWALDLNKQQATQDDGVDRTQLYKENNQRQVAQQTAGSLTDFIDSLKLDIQILPLTLDIHDRAAELCQRTNQFNCTSRRHSQAELENLLATQALEGFAVCVSDRFGDYGIVGLTLFTQSDTSLSTDTFLLSCRAMGRGVEHAMVAELGRLAVERQLSAVTLTYIESAKNEPARGFLQSLGMREVDQVLQLSAAVAKSACYKPVGGVNDEIKVKESSNFSQKNITRVNHYQKVICEFSNINQILKLTESHKKNHGGGVYLAPKNHIEEQLCKICERILRVDQVGMNDDIFDLGGTSIKIVQLAAAIKESIGRAIPIADIMRYPGLRSLAQIINKSDEININELVIGENFVEECIHRVKHSPIEIEPAPNRFWMFRREGRDYRWILNHGFAIDNINGQITFEAFEKAAVAMFVMHETLRARFDKKTKQEYIVDLSEVMKNSPIINLDSGRSSGELLHEIQENIGKIEIDGNLFRFFYLNEGSQVYVVFSAHHALFDGYATQIFIRDFEKTLLHVLGVGNVPLKYELGQYQYWARKLNEYSQGDHGSFDDGIGRDARLWFSQPWHEISKIPFDRAKEGLDRAKNQTGITIIVPGGDSERIDMLAKKIKVHSMDVHLFSLAKSFKDVFSMNTVLFELSDVARQYDFIEQDASTILAYMVSSTLQLIQLDGVSPVVEIIKQSSMFRDQAPNNGLGLGFLRYLSSDSTYKEQVQKIPYPEITYNYQAALGDREEWQSPLFNEIETIKAKDINEKLPVVVEDEDMLRNCVFYISTNYNENGELFTRFEYCKFLFSDDLINRLVNAYLKNLNMGLNEILSFETSIDAKEYYPELMESA